MANPPQENKKPTSSSSRGKYYKFERENALRLIRTKIIDENKTVYETMQDLKIPQRTFSRYLRLAFEPELRQYIAAIPVETLLIQAAIMERRLTQDRKNAYKIIFDPQLDPRQKEAMISGLNFASEVSAGIFRMYNDGLPVVLRHRNELQVDSALGNLTEFEKLPSLTHRHNHHDKEQEQ